MIWDSICNRIFWVKIPHFIMESNATRISFLKTPPPPFESKIPFEGILYCYLPYLFQRVCSFTRGRGAFVRKNYIPKKSFCFVTFQKIFNKYEWKWKFIFFFCFYRYDFHQIKPLLDHPFCPLLVVLLVVFCFNRFYGYQCPDLTSGLASQSSPFKCSSC